MSRPPPPPPPPPSLLRIAHHPPATVGPDDTAREAARVMLAHRVGAVGVVDGDRLVGIFTERDLMVKVVAPGRDPDQVYVGDVMVAEPITLPPDAARGPALDLMVERHFRHLPLVDDDRRLLGILSIRDLLQEQLGRRERALDALERYVSADGPGG